MIKLNQRHLCRITPRAQWGGYGVKPAARAATGEQHIFQPLWFMTAGDPYPGEYAMGIAEREQWARFSRAGISWFASGDLTVIDEEIP